METPPVDRKRFANMTGSAIVDKMKNVIKDSTGFDYDELMLAQDIPIAGIFRDSKVPSRPDSQIDQVCDDILELRRRIFRVEKEIRNFESEPQSKQKKNLEAQHVQLIMLLNAKETEFNEMKAEIEKTKSFLFIDNHSAPEGRASTAKENYRHIDQHKTSDHKTNRLEQILHDKKQKVQSDSKAISYVQQQVNEFKKEQDQKQKALESEKKEYIAQVDVYSSNNKQRLQQLKHLSMSYEHALADAKRSLSLNRTKHMTDVVNRKVKTLERLVAETQELIKQEKESAADVEKMARKMQKVTYQI
jgi:uncharacterized protein YoxC